MNSCSADKAGRAQRRGREKQKQKVKVEVNVRRKCSVM